MTHRTPPSDAAIDVTALCARDRQLLDAFQRDFPLTPRPFADIARRVSCDEAEVIAAYRRLTAGGAISRIGAVVAPHKTGWSTLAAMAVPPARLEEVAALVSTYPEVNHNYEREHAFNLWFVITAPSQTQVAEVLNDIATRTGLDVLDLPMIDSYRLDLGFPLQWT
ncbi:MAG: Lrp/AsnC family transcriptional regulator [Alphaproteobacteria bacterium]|nr:MAG: Lrp/AsnC family transcriptional regulator [Alphaproteobacteria bacterium]